MVVSIISLSIIVRLIPYFSRVFNLKEKIIIITGNSLSRDLPFMFFSFSFHCWEALGCTVTLGTSGICPLLYLAVGTLLTSPKVRTRLRDTNRYTIDDFSKYVSLK